jgi:aminoglycoside 6-adenylyltransferase
MVIAFLCAFAALRETLLEMGTACMMTMDALMERICAWTEECPEVRAAIIIGSRARTDRPADAWSDLDLVLIVPDPDFILARTDWLDAIAPHWLTFLEPTATGDGTERRVLFEGGLDVDFIPISLEALQQILAQGWPEYAVSTIRRGMRLIVDKEGFADRLPRLPAETQTVTAPSQAEFDQLVHNFLYKVVWAAKKLRRGELWTAQSCLDSHMNWRLLRMIAWHAQATQGLHLDTWHNGRFLEQWADPRALEGLREAFAYYDEADVKRALRAMLTLFRWLAQETGERWGYAYPNEADARVTEWLRACLNA